jgi:hypothetical protein
MRKNGRYRQIFTSVVPRCPFQVCGPELTIVVKINAPQGEQLQMIYSSSWMKGWIKNTLSTTPLCCDSVHFSVIACWINPF